MESTVTKYRHQSSVIRTLCSTDSMKNFQNLTTPDYVLIAVVSCLEMIERNRGPGKKKSVISAEMNEGKEEI